MSTFQKLAFISNSFWVIQSSGQSFFSLMPASNMSWADKTVAGQPSHTQFRAVGRFWKLGGWGQVSLHIHSKVIVHLIFEFTAVVDSQCLVGEVWLAYDLKQKFWAIWWHFSPKNKNKVSMIDPLNHLGSIWYHSEPVEVSYSPNQFLGWDFFAVSYSKLALTVLYIQTFF